ncbi:hypothetical protein CKQ16_10185 [Salmonella enterica subsp. enterica serovar Newport]|nr:hypothetical protein [Salmonella enterica subsp. enterica serovar Newport]
MSKLKTHTGVNQLTGVPTPEQLCMFVANNFGNYQGAYLCGKASEILTYLLGMAGYRAKKVTVTINNIGHIFVQCNGLNLDPTIKQFGDYPEVSLRYPLPAINRAFSSLTKGTSK